MHTCELQPELMQQLTAEEQNIQGYLERAYEYQLSLQLACAALEEATSLMDDVCCMLVVQAHGTEAGSTAASSAVMSRAPGLGWLGVEGGLVDDHRRFAELMPALVADVAVHLDAAKDFCPDLPALDAEVGGWWHAWWRSNLRP